MAEDDRFVHVHGVRFHGICIFLFMLSIMNSLVVCPLPKWVHRVSNCPDPNNLTAWILASRSLNCIHGLTSTNPLEQTHVYHCIPSAFRNESVEFCGRNEPIEPYNCPVYNYQFGPNISPSYYSCATFTRGCPAQMFFSKDVYKYVDCLVINRVNRCYVAQKNCNGSDERTSTQFFSTTVSVHNGTSLNDIRTTQSGVFLTANDISTESTFPVVNSTMAYPQEMTMEIWLLLLCVTELIIVLTLTAVIFVLCRRKNMRVPQDLTNETYELGNLLEGTDNDTEVSRYDLLGYTYQPTQVNSKNSSETVIKFWRTEDEQYVVCHFYEKVLRMAKTLPFMTIVGRAGVGKTALARHLALKLESEGFRLVCIERINDFEHCKKYGGKIVAVFDDAFGVFSLNMTTFINIEMHKRQILDLLGPTFKLFITCRPSVYRQAQQLNSFLTSKRNIFDFERQGNFYDEEDQIAVDSISNAKDNSFKITENIPWIFMKPNLLLMSKLVANQGKYILEHQADIIEKQFEFILQYIDELHDQNKITYCALIYCMFLDKILSDEFCTGHEEEIKSNIISSVMKLRNGIMETELYSALDNFKEMNMDNCVTEITAYHYGKCFPDQMFKFMRSSFIYSKMFTESSNRGFSVLIQESQYHLLAKRIERDIRRCYFYEVFQYISLYDSKFLHFFFEMLDRKPCDEIQEIFLTKKEKQNLVIAMNKLDNVNDNTQSSVKIHELLIDKRSEKNMTTYNVKAVSWIVYYGHAHLLRYIIERLQLEHLSTEIVFGSHQEDQARFLVVACLSGNIETVEIILDNVNIKCVNLDVHCNDRFPNPHRVITPMIAACMCGKLKLFQKLIDSGADLKMCDAYGRSPLYTASAYGHFAVVKSLIQRTDFFYFERGDNTGKTPLYVASESGHHSVVKILIEAGANINKCDLDEKSPLYVASENGHKKVVDMLIENGAECNICDSKGKSPLYKASELGYESVVKVLLKHGAVCNICEMYSRSPLYISSQNNHLQIVKLLIDSDANLNSLDFYHKSSMYVAAQYGHDLIVKVLIDGGGDCNLRDLFNKSPLHVASKAGHLSIVNLLINHGVEINRRDFEGKTALFLASESGHLGVVNRLLNAGADVSKHDKNGRLPLQVTSNFLIVKSIMEVDQNKYVSETDDESSSYTTPAEVTNSSKEIHYVSHTM